MKLKSTPVGLGLVVGILAGLLASWAQPAWGSRNSSGTYSLPSGNPVVTGTTISTTWANNTLTDIKTEITNSLDRGGRGAMTAPLQCTNGTVAAPSLTFATDTDTGLYRIGANNPAMAAGGVKIEDWSSTGASLSAGATVVQSQADTFGVVSTGNGTGGGIKGTGGSAGNGVEGYGTGIHTGVFGLGGNSSGVGVAGTGGTSNGIGVTGTGTGTGAGGSFTGGTTGGGIIASGGGTSGVGGTFSGIGGSAGVVATATGAGSGLKGTGGAGGVGVEGISSGGAAVTGSSSGAVGGSFTGTDGLVVNGFSGGGVTSAGTTYGGDFTGGTVGISCTGGSGAAISIGTGHAKFTSSNPTTTTAFSKTLTPKNIIKTWGKFTIGSGSATVSDGFNLTSCSVVSTHVECTLASAMTSTSYAIVTGTYQVGSVGCFWAASAVSATVIRLDGYKWNGSAVVASDASADTLAGSFEVIGSQ